jgi:hypothetical protein
MTTGKTILDLTVTIAAALNVDRFGRRPLFLTAICGMFQGPPFYFVLLLTSDKRHGRLLRLLDH